MGLKRGPARNRSKRPSSTFQGQGATEYLVLLGVVMLIGLVAVSLLDFSKAGSSIGAPTQSEIYWRNAAHPIAITSVNVNGPGRVTMVVQNRKGQSITLNSIEVNSQPVIPLLDGEPLPVTMPAGEESVITFIAPSFECETAKTEFSEDIEFVYALESGLEQIQAGGEPLAATCSSACIPLNQECVEAVSNCCNDRYGAPMDCVYTGTMYACKVLSN
jgi:hypothetical protein